MEISLLVVHADIVRKHELGGSKVFDFLFLNDGSGFSEISVSEWSQSFFGGSGDFGLAALEEDLLEFFGRRVRSFGRGEDER